MMGNLPLLKEIASEKKKLISQLEGTLDEIDQVVDLFKKQSVRLCIARTYPLKDEDANLKCIETLRKRYNCKVGYSGHETSLIKVSLAGNVRCYIFRKTHNIRSCNVWFRPSGFYICSLRNLVETVRSVEKILGDGNKKFLIAKFR